MFGSGVSSVRSKGWQITGLCGGLYFGFTFAWNSLAALIPNIASDLALTELETGILLGTVAMTIFFTWPVLGPGVERVGPNRAMLIGTFAVAVAGGARAYAGGFLSLVVAMAFLSLGGSTVTYGFPTTVASWFDAGDAGTPMGVATVCATLGTVAGFELMPAVAAEFGGWRPALLVASGPSLTFGLMWFRLGRMGPHRDESDPPSIKSVPELLRRPEIGLIVLAGVAYLFATHSVYGWLAPLLMERGIDLTEATRLVAILTAGQIVGIVLIPYLADRWTNRELFVGVCGGAFAGAVALLSVLPGRIGALTVVAAIAGIAIGGISPLLRTLPVERVPSKTVSTVVSMVFGVGALGGFVGPVVIGATLSATGDPLSGFGLLAVPGITFVFLAVLLLQFRAE